MKNPILEQFILESRDYLQRVGEILIKLEEEQSKDLLNELFRIVHTLKGNSGLFNFSAMTKLLHASEDLMNSLRDETISYSSQIADILLESMDIVSQMIDEVEAYGEPQLSTNERAQQKALLIREILSEKKQIETSDAPKHKSEEKTLKHYDYLVIPEEFRIKIVKAFFEGKNPIIVKYMPEEECFYKGEDPLFYVRKIPETIWSRFYLREKIDDIMTFDIYRCITNFEAVTTADEETLKEHFKYVLDQIEFIKPEIVSFIVPHGDKNGGPVYEDFVLDFRELLKSESIDILKNSLRAIKELTAPTLFVASCLRWIEALIDYTPKSTPYIEALIRSIETLEPPMFDKILDSKKFEAEEIKVEKPIKTFEIPAELFRVFEEQRKVLEKIKDKDENIRRNTISSIILSLENAFKSIKNEELLEKFKREVKEENLETIISFIDEFIKEEKIITEEVKQLTETQTVKTQKEERIISKSEEPTTTKFLRVDEEKVNRLMNLISELVVAKNSLLYLLKKVEREYGIASLSKEMKIQYSVINRISEEMQDAIMQVRMIPVATVFQRFPRLVRDLSKKLGKNVKLHIEGEDTEADKNVIEALTDPLIHLVRNSLDHGVELPEERIAKGKPETATITLRAKQEADRVIIQVEDDGRGIDPEKIKIKAYEKGLITEEELSKIKDDEVLNLIFLPGFSTKEETSELSGRGVGMDVVRTMVERFNGTVSVSSEKDRGTTVTMALPLSMAVSHVMLIEAAGRKYAFPLDVISETVRIREEDIHTFKGEMVVSLRGKVLPLFFLNDLLDLKAPALKNENNEYATVVINLKGEMFAVIVDSLLGTADIILKPFKGFLSSLRVFSGTAILGDGSVLLVINPKELIYGS